MAYQRNPWVLLTAPTEDWYKNLGAMAHEDVFLLRCLAGLLCQTHTQKKPTQFWRLLFCQSDWPITLHKQLRLCFGRPNLCTAFRTHRNAALSVLSMVNPAHEQWWTHVFATTNCYCLSAIMFNWYRPLMVTHILETVGNLVDSG